MKNTKRARRAAAFAAAVVMAACAAVPMGSSFSASAATITVTETEANHIFKAYQIFNGTVGTDGTVSGITWGEGFTDVNNTIYTDLQGTKIQVDGKEIFTNVSSPAEVADALSKLTSGSADTYGDMDKVASVFQKHINTANAKTFTQKTDGTGYELTDANDGYYLIVDEVPTDGSVTSVSKYFMNVAGENKAENTIAPKRDQPQVMKKIKENTKVKDAPTFKNVTTADTGYNDTADYCIGDSVPFKLYGSLPSTLDNYQNGYKYVFHDSLDTEFDVPTAVTVKVGDHYVKAATSETDKTGYWFTTNAHAFDIAFADIKSVKLYTNAECTIEAGEDVKVSPTDVVTVSYDAVLNATAKIGRPGQKNDVYLEYANDSNWNGEGTPTTSETPHDNVIAFTYELDLTKVDGADKSKTLAGASFVLERTVGSQKQYAVLDANKKITDWLTTTGTVTVDTTKGTVATDGTWTSVYGKTPETPATPTISTTEAAGTFSYIGLDDGTYVVREVKAPTGYKIAAGGQEFTFVVSADTTNGQDGKGVDAEGTALKTLKLYKDSVDVDNNNLLNTADEENDKVGKVDTTITNTSSSTLPSTGGIGTTMFYVGGGVLVAGAGVLLITKKRAKKDAE